MAIDFLASARSTAIVSLVAASFSAPVVVQGDALASVKAKFTGAKVAHAEPAEDLLAGGVQFAMPVSWGRLGAGAASDGASGSERIATVVTALCPGGLEHAACHGDAKLTFLAYSGDDGRELPPLSEFGDQLDAQLAREYPGFTPETSHVRTGADDTRYLDYRFAWTPKGGATQHQRLAAFRHKDGSGVVVLGVGAEIAEHEAAIDAFLASAQRPGADH